MDFFNAFWRLVDQILKKSMCFMLNHVNLQPRQTKTLEMRPYNEKNMERQVFYATPFNVSVTCSSQVLGQQKMYSIYLRTLTAFVAICSHFPSFYVIYFYQFMSSDDIF